MPLFRTPYNVPVFRRSVIEPIKELPSITPDPQMIMKITNDKNELIDMKKGSGQSTVKEEKAPKAKKKRLPGERMLKKLVNHKDDDADEKKLKRIIRAIRNTDVPAKNELFF